MPSNHSTPEEEPRPYYVQEALDIGNDILQAIKGLDRDVRAKAPDFFRDVRNKTASICETIRDYNRVSDKQRAALDNMKKGVRRWTHDDEDDD